MGGRLREDTENKASQVKRGMGRGRGGWELEWIGKTPKDKRVNLEGMWVGELELRNRRGADQRSVKSEDFSLVLILSNRGGHHLRGGMVSIVPMIRMHVPIRRST